MMSVVWQGIGSAQVGGWHWKRCSRAAGGHARMVVCVKKKPEIGLENFNEEIMLDHADLMQLKLGRLLGQSREFTLAKVVAKKLNPHLNNLEAEKLVKKKGVNNFLRMASESLKVASDVNQAVSDVEEEEQVGETNKQAEEVEGVVALLPRPKPSQDKNMELSRERFLKVLNMEDDEPSSSSLPLSSLTAASTDWFDRAEISMERFVKLLDEGADSEATKKDEEEQRPPRPARKFDRRPLASDTIGRRRRSKGAQKPFTSSPSANRKITKTKGKVTR